MLERPKPVRMKLPPSHLTFHQSCQMREVTVSDDADYLRAARGICKVGGYDQSQVDDILHNLRAVCCPDGERPIAPPHLVAEYFERMGAGDEFPPLLVVKQAARTTKDQSLTYWVFSGFTRGAAALLHELPEVDCLVYDGTLADAEFYALSENRAHGMRTGYGDKSKAVRALVKRPDLMQRCKDRVEPGIQLALAMAQACGVSSELVRHVLRADGFRVEGTELLPLETTVPVTIQEIRADLTVMGIDTTAAVEKVLDATHDAEIVVVESQPEPLPSEQHSGESRNDSVSYAGSADGDKPAESGVTPEPEEASGESVSNTYTPDDSHSPTAMSSDAQLPPLVPHRYAALMASTTKLAGEWTKAIRATDDAGGRLRECLGACGLLDFVPERVDGGGVVTPAHVDFLPLRGLVKVLDLAGGSEAKVAKVKHQYGLASGGFVPPSVVRWRKVKQGNKPEGGK